MTSYDSDLPHTVDTFGRACCHVALMMRHHNLLRHSPQASWAVLEGLTMSDAANPDVDLEGVLSATEADLVRRLTASVYTEWASGAQSRRMVGRELTATIIICMKLGGIMDGTEWRFPGYDATVEEHFDSVMHDILSNM